MLITFRKSSSKGMSVIEILFAFGIIAITAASIAFLIIRMKQEQKYISTKLEYSSLQATVVDLLSRTQDCSCQLAGMIFDASNPATEIQLPTLKMSCTPGAADLIKTPLAPASTADLSVEQILVTDIISTENSNEYTASLFIRPDLQTSLRRLKAVPIRIRFNTNPDTPDNAKSIVGCGSVPLSTPNNLNATFGNAQCALSWNPSSGARPISYTVMRSTAPGGASSSTIQACPTTTTTTCTATGLTNGTLYYFSVQASNADESSGWSSEALCKPIMPADPPVLTATAANQRCDLSWPPPAGTPPLTYTVYKSTTQPVTKSSTVACNNISATSCASIGLTNGTPYFYAAIATNQAGESNLSNEISCIPCPTGYHFVGSSCVQTFIIIDYTRTTLTGTTNHPLGSHHYCVLTSFLYDGTGPGTCALTGTQDGSWNLAITDEGPTAQSCTVRCSDIEMLGTDPLPGSICSDSGKTGIRLGTCCATGTSTNGIAGDISCN